MGVCFTTGRERRIRRGPCRRPPGPRPGGAVGARAVFHNRANVPLLAGRSILLATQHVMMVLLPVRASDCPSGRTLWVLAIR